MVFPFRKSPETFSREAKLIVEEFYYGGDFDEPVKEN